MKEVSCCVDVAGEDFSGAIEAGCKTEKNTSGPFRRSLPFIEDRNKRVLDGGRGNFREYDDTDTVNQS
jgi:hypothetical protein